MLLLYAFIHLLALLAYVNNKAHITVNTFVTVVLCSTVPGLKKTMRKEKTKQRTDKQ